MNARHSLRARLWLAGAVGVLLAAGLAAWALGAQFERSALAAFERRLEDDQLTLIGLLEHDTAGVRLAGEPSDSRYQRVFSGSYWQVGEGAAAARSRSLWDAELALPPLPQRGASQAVDLRGPQQQQLRALLRRVNPPGSASDILVLVAGDVAPLQAEARSFRTAVALGAALVAALLFAVLLWQVHYGLRPLRALARQLAEVRAGARERVPVQGLPSEVQPLAHHLNELLEQHEGAVRRARHAAGDLAHAIKTPLAVLDAAAQRPDATLAATVAEHLARIRVAVERHLAAGTPMALQQHCRVAPVVDDLFALLQRAHECRGLSAHHAVSSDLSVRCAREDLEEMLGNLIDNAFKWARQRIEVQARREASHLVIDVLDDGAGLPAQGRKQALRRHERLDERAAGSGLGLAIALELALAAGGALSLHDNPRGNGLCARLVLPRHDAVLAP